MEATMFCSNCGEPVAEGKAFCKNCGAPLAGPVAVPPAPPPAPKSGGGRAGLVIGIVVAMVVVLAGVGTGTYLLARDGEAAESTTSLAGTSTVTSETGSTLTVSSTTSTAPSSTISTGAPTRTTRRPTLTSRPVLGDAYLAATDAVAEMLLFYDERIPQLAAMINASAPAVPREVYDELESMMLSLEETYDGLGEIPLPAGFEESDYWLDEAILFMDDRLFATLQGIEAMWDSGSAAAGDSFFEKGRQARDDFHAAWSKYHEVLPID
jgi:hypothetical protein